jgi:hypothetical protein
MQHAWESRAMHIEFWWERRKERDDVEHPDIGRRVILRWNLEKNYGVLWTRFICLRLGTSFESCEINNEAWGHINWEILG